MRRRTFLASGLAAAGGLLTAGSARAASPVAGAADEVRTWHFWDLWRLDRRSALHHEQGRAEWQPAGTYVEPHIGALASWPTVFRQDEGWRMLYSAAWKPYSLMIAESDDGIRWRPAPREDIVPAGEKRAAHHIFTLPSGSGGGVYLDPVAEDGFPFKVFVHQQGEPVAERAAKDPAHQWHEVARRAGAKRYLNEEFTLVSRDGLHWSEMFEYAWSRPEWHPEPPIFGFYNRRTKRHAMTVRPGWGDRRQCLQTTSDFRQWSGPRLILQPDPLDRELIELYGMPVFPCGDGYVGLLWVFHCESAEPTRGFNRFVGPLDCQLAFSYDGQRFFRGPRRPFIATNDPGEHGGGAIEPSCLVETDGEIRIYSSASQVHHGRSGDARRRGVDDAHSILLHTLRKDGFMYLEGRGDWGRFTSKPLTLRSPRLTMNAAAPLGEVRYQLADLESRPIEGFTFDDCLPLDHGDALDFRLRWRDAAIEDLMGKIVRLEVTMRHARLYALRGRWHFIDAQDRWLLEDGRSLDSPSE